MTPAGFWRRLAAYFIDSMFIAFITLPMLTIIIMQTSLKPFPSIRADQGVVTEDYLDDLADNFVDHYQESVKKGLVYSFVIQFIFAWCYFAGMESSPLRATIGKLAVGIYVVDDSGERLSFGRATGRHFGKIISGLIVGIGYIMAGFTSQKKALHDMMAGALVVAKEGT